MRSLPISYKFIYPICNPNSQHSYIFTLLANFNFQYFPITSLSHNGGLYSFLCIDIYDHGELNGNTIKSSNKPQGVYLFLDICIAYANLSSLFVYPFYLLVNNDYPTFKLHNHLEDVFFPNL